MRLVLKSLILLSVMIVKSHADEVKPLAPSPSEASAENLKPLPNEIKPVVSPIPEKSAETSKPSLDKADIPAEEAKASPDKSQFPMAETKSAEDKLKTPLVETKPVEDKPRTAGVETKTFASKAKPPLKPLAEMSMGSSDAPVIMLDYSSLTCGHCAHFHTVVLPKIEEKYIKPGYVRIIFRDYPGDQISLKAHQLAWCKGEIKYLDFVKLLYSTQEKWLMAKDPIAALKLVALKNGISAEQFESCLKDQELMDKIIQVRLEGQKKYNITATPTIVINTKVYNRTLTFEEFEKIVRPLLAPTLKKAEKSTKKKGDKISVEKVKKE